MPFEHRPVEYRFRTGDQALVRQINLSVILHHLRENAPISRAGLAEITGLNKTTVSSLVRELIEANFVHEVGLQAPGSGHSAGRHAVMLTLDPHAGHIVSCDIGVDFISVICTDFAPNIFWRQTEHIQPEIGQRAIIDRALALLLKGIEEGRKTSETLLGVAVGVPGLVDQASGTLLFAPNLRWKDVPLRSILQSAINAPVFVDNEASLAALGEHYFGAAQNHKEVVYISAASVGLGGGIVHNGLLFSGVTGFGGEFGHMTMDPDGELCNCGNRGCWETQVSQRALFKHIKSSLAQGQASLLTDLTHGDLEQLSMSIILESARAGDPLARSSLEKVGRDLGIGIACLVNALNPELIVFGGTLSQASEFLLPVVYEELQRRALPWTRDAMQLVVARHGADACMMGGIAKVYQAILAEPGRIERRNIPAISVYEDSSMIDLDRKEVSNQAQ